MPMDHAAVKVATVVSAPSTAARDVFLVAMPKPSVVSTLQSQGRNVLSTCVVRNLGMLPLRGFRMTTCTYDMN
jgi:hypothetical protein